MSVGIDYATDYLPLSGLRNGSDEHGTVNGIEDDADKNATSIASTWINYSATNRSQHFKDLMRKDFVFDRTDVRVLFILLYSLVFCCCFCGMCGICSSWNSSTPFTRWFRYTCIHTVQPTYTILCPYGTHLRWCARTRLNIFFSLLFLFVFFSLLLFLFDFRIQRELHGDFSGCDVQAAAFDNQFLSGQFSGG